MKKMIRAFALVLVAVMLLPPGATAVDNPAQDSYNSGRARQNENNWRGAIADFNQAVTLKPDFADAYLNRASAKQSVGDLEGTLADNTKAIELKPDFAVAYYNRGKVKSIRGDTNGALADFTKAIALQPDYASAYFARGKGRHDRGDLDDAIADFTKTVELDPYFVGGYSALGRARQDKGDLDGAIADFGKAILNNPYLGDGFALRGYAKYKKGDLDGATLDYTKALTRNIGFTSAHSKLGCLHYDRRDFAAALADYRKWIEVASPLNHPVSAHLRIWLIRTRLGEQEAATRELQTYLNSPAAGQPSRWPIKVGRFLTGQLSEPELLTAAKNADAKTEAGQLDEAYFYAGSKHLFAGDKAAATACFQKSIATGLKDNEACQSAAAELKFLEKP